ncbi:ATP-binding protein [Paracoccus limosus]|nr:ATP-binding protein [Paracoccus limosus]
MTLTRLLPQGLAGRFSALLVVALLAVNLIAALLLAREGSTFDRAIRLEGDRPRLQALITALEAADRATGLMLPGYSSTGFTRFSVGPTPLDLPGSQRLPALEARLALEMGTHPVELREGPGPLPGEAREPLLMVSVQLQRGGLAGQWLNALSYPLPQPRAWVWKAGFFVPLLASLIGTLLVGLVFVRRMTQPLRALAEAARAAGRGDRSARVTECGASELRDAAAAFNDMQRRIAGFEAERLRMLAAVGHDLRTPITGLRLRAELLDDDSQRGDMIRMLDDMAAMAQGLLDSASASAEPEPPQPTDLDALIGQLCRDRGLAHVAQGPVMARVPPVALRRALGNLVDNALRYAGPPRLHLQAGASDILITVEDDGPGIPEPLLARMTEPFVRGEASRSAATGGAGLGLFIARDILRAHGGSLRLRNRPEGGLCVELRLPRVP